MEQPQNPGNPNPLPVKPLIPMANNQLNWSHFRPEFSGTPSEDAEAHLLRMEDWVTIHNFLEDQKVGRFCLTLTGEARLWYATLNVPQQQLNWDGLRERFRHNTPNLVIPKNNISTRGDLFNLMKQPIQ